MKIKNFTCFKTIEKKKETEPDYRLSARLEDDTFVEIGGGWIKEGAKGKFISFSLSKPYNDKAGFCITEEKPEVATTDEF